MSGHGPRRDPVKERFWRKTVRQQEASGLKIREFCGRQGLAETAFHAWRREIQRRDRQASQSTALTRPTKTRRPSGRPRFLPVSVANVTTPFPLEVALPSGVVLRLGRDCDSQTLRAVLGALKESAC